MRSILPQLCAAFAALGVAACTARGAFRPAFGPCPDGTRLETLQWPGEEEGASFVQNERWCERPDGKRHGPYASWDDPGPSAVEGEFQDGERSGRWVHHYWGKKSEEGLYRGGKQHGRWISYDEGRVTRVWTYRDGALNGPASLYCGNGVVEEEGSYRHSQPDGRWIWRYCSGRIKRTGWYREGQEVGEWKSYDESGQELGPETKPTEK